MPWQLHSRTAFTTVSWFYVALTPRRQRKQKMKRMKPTMAITFHMRALRVAATSLNQKSDTFIPTECGTFVCYCRSSYCCKLLATQFLGLKVLRLPNAEISDFLLRPWKIGNHKKIGQSRTAQLFSRQEPQKDKTGHNPTDQNGHYTIHHTVELIFVSFVFTWNF